ncbi:hypothetical protein L218DRAFT_1067448 [Marasmius fiardii PR-910]|nr:hypothetical protein L218DRAFT_1067448 [Marasmius fiardii PR-910]
MAPSWSHNEIHDSVALVDYNISITIEPLLEVLIPAILYGVYAVLYGICVKVLRHRRTENYLLYSTIMTALFLLATAGLVFTVLTVAGKNSENLNMIVPNRAGADVSVPFLRPLLRAFLCVTVLSSLLADLVLVLRCYFIWGQRLAIVLVPTIVCVACGVAGFFTAATAKDDIPLKPGSQFVLNAKGITPFFFAFIITEVVLNVFLTCMIAGKIILIQRQVRMILGARVKKMHHVISVIIIESGMIYPITLILLASLSTTVQAGNIAIGFSLVQVVGMAPTLIVGLTGEQYWVLTLEVLKKGLEVAQAVMQFYICISTMPTVWFNTACGNNR